MGTGYTNSPYYEEENQNIEQPEIHLETTQEAPIDFKAKLQEIQQKSVEQLKSALVINQILAASVELMSKYHLTKSEKERIVQRLNNCKTLEEVPLLQEIIENELNVGKSQDELMEVKDCIWSENFKSIVNIVPRYSNEDVAKIQEGSQEVEKYFELLSVYASSQDDQEKMQKTGEEILIQEGLARKGLSKIIAYSA